jgi:hypothetical protein
MRFEVVVLAIGEPSFISAADLTGAVQVPVYTASTQEGTVSTATKASSHIRRGRDFPIESRLLRPRTFVSCEADKTIEEKTDMLRQLWTMFQEPTEADMDRLALFQCHEDGARSCERSATNKCCSN